MPITSFQPPHLCQMTVCAISEDFWESGFYKHLWKFWQRILSKPIPLRLTTIFFFNLGKTLFFLPFTHPSTHLVCCCSVTQSCPIFCDPMDCSTPDFPVPHCLLELALFMFIELVMLSNHLILCSPLLLLPSIFPSLRGFSSESTLHQVTRILELQHQSFQ